MSNRPPDYVVLVVDAQGRRRPFGSSRHPEPAERLARQLRKGKLAATVERGRLLKGRFVPADKSE